MHRAPPGVDGRVPGPLQFVHTRRRGRWGDGSKDGGSLLVNPVDKKKGVVVVVLFSPIRTFAACRHRAVVAPEQ